MWSWIAVVLDVDHDLLIVESQGHMKTWEYCPERGGIVQPYEIQLPSSGAERMYPKAYKEGLETLSYLPQLHMFPFRTLSGFLSTQF